jgi:hypothetical protein
LFYRGTFVCSYLVRLDAFIKLLSDNLPLNLVYYLAAIATVVTVAEILKNNGLAVEKRILTSTVDMRDEARGRPIQKAKVEIILVKSGQFDELMAAAAEEREVAPEVEDQS